jgi:hypothetical protein
VASAAELIDRSFPAANDAIARLTKADVLQQITIGRRNRAFEAKEVIDAFASLERQLASPEGDIRHKSVVVATLHGEGMPQSQHNSEKRANIRRGAV